MFVVDRHRPNESIVHRDGCNILKPRARVPPTSLIKRSFHKYTFLVLSFYEALSDLQPRWDLILKKRGAEVRRESNKFKEGFNSLKG